MSWQPFVNPEAQRVPRKLKKRAQRRGYNVHCERKQWGRGPWDTERDLAEWVHLGVLCKMLRHETMGHWCGYAAVERGHPLYGLGYDDMDLSAPGGLTYAREDSDYLQRRGRPHAPPAWWLGFDCAHCDDISPGLSGGVRGIPMMLPGATYKTEAWVRAMLEDLAEQIAAQGPVVLRFDWTGENEKTVTAVSADPSSRLARRCSVEGCDAKPVSVRSSLCPIHSLRKAAAELHQLDPERFPATQLLLSEGDKESPP